MEESEKKTQQETEQKKHEPEDNRDSVSETWAQETIADLDDFIESQGIYIRQ